MSAVPWSTRLSPENLGSRSRVEANESRSRELLKKLDESNVIAPAARVSRSVKVQIASCHRQKGSSVQRKILLGQLPITLLIPLHGKVPVIPNKKYTQAPQNPRGFKVLHRPTR